MNATNASQTNPTTLLLATALLDIVMLLQICAAVGQPMHLLIIVQHTMSFGSGASVIVAPFGFLFCSRSATTWAYGTAAIEAKP
jgi:hypothetical protein